LEDLKLVWNGYFIGIGSNSLLFQPDCGFVEVFNPNIFLVRAFLPKPSKDDKRSPDLRRN
jgi:hypothetical protein